MGFKFRDDQIFHVANDSPPFQSWSLSLPAGAKPRKWTPLTGDTQKGIKGALNPNFLNLTKNREKFCL